MRPLLLLVLIAAAGNPVFAQTAATIVVTNDSSGTSATLLACLNASTQKAITCPTNATGVLGICLTTPGTCGTSGNATIAVAGDAICTFDTPTTAGDYVAPSSSTAGNCSDAGATYPSGGSNLVGRVLATHAGAGPYLVVLAPPEQRPGVPAGTSTTQYGAAYAASSSANSIAYTNAGATGTVLQGGAPPAFTSNLSVSGSIQVNGSSAGCLHLESGSFDSEICAPSAATQTWVLTVPTVPGTNGYPLVTDGSGNTSWAQLGNSALANSAVTVSAGTNLSGGGSVPLGGTTTLSLASPLTSGVDLGQNSFSIELANAGSPGTTQHKLAKLTGAPSQAIITTHGDTHGAIGVVIGGAGTSSPPNAQIAVLGQAFCTFDNATTAGDYVQMSSSADGECTDAGSIYPSSGQVIGRVLHSSGSPGANVDILLLVP